MPVLLGLLLATACRPGPRSTLTFDQVRAASLDKTEGEVFRHFGSPNRCQSGLADSELCLWEDFTALPGAPMSVLGRIPAVDLEITFVCPAGLDPRTAPHTQWRAIGPLAVNYSIPSSPRR